MKTITAQNPLPVLRRFTADTDNTRQGVFYWACRACSLTGKSRRLSFQFIAMQVQILSSPFSLSSIRGSKSIDEAVPRTAYERCEAPAPNIEVLLSASVVSDHDELS